MISPKNLIINTSANTKIDTAVKSDALPSNLKMSSNGKTSKNDKENPGTPDPAAFVALLGQVLSDSKNEPIPTDVSKNTELQDTNALLTKNTSTKGLPENLTATLTAEDQKLVDLQAAQQDSNPALTWIDSKSFQSLTPIAAQIKSQMTDLKDASTQTDQLANIANMINGTADKQQVKDGLTVLQGQPQAGQTQAQATQLASDLVPIGALPLDKIKEELAQSLQVSGADKQAVAEKRPEELLAQHTPVNNLDANGLANQTATTTAAKTVEISVPVNNPQWADKFSEQIAWLGQQGIKSAQIKIHPEDLGPIEINIKMDKNDASVNIVSHSAMVRDIIEQAMPKLRDMMAEQGLNLSDVHINSDQGSRQSSQGSAQKEPDRSFVAPEDEIQLVSTPKKPPKRLVDYFA